MPGRTAAAARVAPWVPWAAVVFGLYNAGADRAEVRRVEAEIAAGRMRPTFATRLLPLRAFYADDGDVGRYEAYAAATLGRAHERFFVRAMSEWLESFRRPNPEGDPDGASPKVVPPRPLVPYRDFAVEYPPGFFLFALPPAFAQGGGGSATYRLLFCSLMAALLTVALAACARHLPLGPGGRTLPPRDAATLVLLAAAAALLLGKVTTHRFDAVVAACVCVALWAASRRRPIALGASLGVAVVTKLVPLALAPLFVLYLVEGRRHRELLVASVAATVTAAAFALPAALAAGPAILDITRYHAERPLQIESSAAALLGLLHAALPSSLQVVKTFGSTNVVGGASPILLALVAPAMLGALAAVCAITWRRLRAATGDGASAGRGASVKERVLGEGTAAALVALMVTGKVFSPQYLVWLLPLGLLLALGRAGRDRALLAALLLAAMGLTQLIFPFSYGALMALAPAACALVLLRNALLVWFAARLLADDRPTVGAARAT